MTFRKALVFENSKSMLLKKRFLSNVCDYNVPVHFRDFIVSILAETLGIKMQIIENPAVVI